MRQLEVVAVSDDGGYVLLAGDENASRATHAVRIDNRLHAAIRGELDDSDERRESELSPRDIQARLRAGETTEAVAKAAKVPIARVMRYAGPVLSERERIVDQAQAAFLQRSRGPAASTPLGAAVEKRLAGTAGLRPETIVWDARRRDDGAWVVVLNYSARGARSALWLWQPAERALTSLNTLATRLAADDATPAPRRSAPRKVASKPAPRRRAAASRGTRRRTAKRAAASSRTAKRGTTTRRTAKRAAAKPTATRRSTAARRPSATAAAASRRTTKPAAKRTASAAKRTASAAKRTASAAKRTASSAKRATSARTSSAARTAATTRAPAKRATTTAKTAVRATATRPPGTKAPVRRRPPRVTKPPVIEAPARRKNGRVELPSWSDVLLGVQAPPARGRRRS